MTEPVFSVPLSALIAFEKRWWRCSWCNSGEQAAQTPDEARAAAIEHLGGVHGIQAAGKPAGDLGVCGWCRHEIFIHIDPKCPVHQDKEDGISW